MLIDLKIKDLIVVGAIALATGTDRLCPLREQCSVAKEN